MYDNNNTEEIQNPYGIDENFRDELRAQFEMYTINNNTAICTNEEIKVINDDGSVKVDKIDDKLDDKQEKLNKLNCTNDDNMINNDKLNVDDKIVNNENECTFVKNKIKNNETESQLNDSQELHN